MIKRRVTTLSAGLVMVALMVASAVALASPAHAALGLRENADAPPWMTNGKVYAQARQAQGDSELLDAIVASPPAVDPKGLQGGGDLSALSDERLREGLRLVREKGADQDVEAYKAFVLEVARAAAEAHKEGGFAGIGGKPVSDEEQAVLDEIAEALR